MIPQVVPDWSGRPPMAKVPPPRPALPLGPLLRQFRPGDVAHPSLVAASPPEVDAVADEGLAAELRGVAERVLPVVWHPAVFAREVKFLRHALSHLFRGQDPLPERLARCHAPGEAYHVPGLGPGFWSAVVRSLDPETVPHWCPAIERGLARLGFLSAGGRGAAERFATVQEAWKRARHLAPGLDAAQFAVFLERVS